MKAYAASNRHTLATLAITDPGLSPWIPRHWPTLRDRFGPECKVLPLSPGVDDRLVFAKMLPGTELEHRTNRYTQ